MADDFYSMADACAKLGMTEQQVMQLVRDGKLREFRQNGQPHFKVEDIDAMAAESSGQSSSIALEAVEEADTGLSASDVISLDEVSGRPAGKDDTVITSVGISVFDDEDLEIDVDPMAKTQIAPSLEDQISLEGAGSGSGLLDLTRESDDTSLGAELLDEIYPGESETLAAEGPETPAVAAPSAEMAPPAYPEAAYAAPVEVVEPDATAPAFAGLTIIALIVLVVLGIAAAAGVREVQPAFLTSIEQNLTIFVIGTVIVALLVLVVGMLLGKQAAARRTTMQRGG